MTAPATNGSAAASIPATSTVVNVGVAGLGRIGQNHATNLARLKDVKVIAVVSVRRVGAGQQSFKLLFFPADP